MIFRIYFKVCQRLRSILWIWKISYGGKIYTRTKLSRGKIRPTFPVFKVDKNNIISFDDSDNSYIFSIMQLSTKTWIEITYDDFLSILESLECQAFTNKALLYFTPCCLKYIFLIYLNFIYMVTLLNFYILP